MRPRVEWDGQRRPRRLERSAVVLLSARPTAEAASRKHTFSLSAGVLLSASSFLETKRARHRFRTFATQADAPTLAPKVHRPTFCGPQLRGRHPSARRRQLPRLAQAPGVGSPYFTDSAQHIRAPRLQVRHILGPLQAFSPTAQRTESRGLRARMTTSSWDKKSMVHRHPSPSKRTHTH